MMAGAHVRQRVSPHFSLSSGHLEIIKIMATLLPVVQKKRRLFVE